MIELSGFRQRGGALVSVFDLVLWSREGKTVIARWIPGERPARALAAHWRALLGGKRSEA